MLIELHIIQNHSPANLNRDDLGAPKTCVFGGVTRARISSQCLKRSIRFDDLFQPAFEGSGAVRTRDLIAELARRASGSTSPPAELLKKVKEVFALIGLKTTSKSKAKQDEHDAPAEQTENVVFISTTALEEMQHVFTSGSTTPAADIAEILSRSTTVPDIALSGRMMAFTPSKEFKGYNFTVEASLSAAHAISTHEVVTEIDYFTTVDDIEGSKGAAHVNEAMFNSACFYKHFCIDWNQLVKNLDGDVDLAAKTVKHFMLAAALATPSGKQHSFAAFNPPDGILVEVKTKRCVPMSHANAFVHPVTRSPDRDLVSESISRLGQHAHDMAVGYGVEADRLWFSPAHRHPLEYVDRSEPSHARLAKPLLPGDRFMGSLDELVDRTMSLIAAEAGAAS